MSAEDLGPGPFDLAKWPEHLRARVVTPGARPRVRGYDVEGDLARHYSFAEGVLLALSGELPTEAQGRAFEVAMQFLSPAPIDEAPTHAAALARICAATDAGVVATAALGLTEQARFAVRGLASFLTWLDAPVGPPPDCALATSDDEREAVARLRAALGEQARIAPALPRDLGRTAALVAILHACGLRKPHAIEAAWVVARLASSVAEAMSNKRRGFVTYPTQLPRFDYEEP